ncbi:MAG TPA: DUF2059 domain-containing protein [Candidatus Acidoferrales bacterium]|nr:DUF2059 domain-containing protein [Candidatus Acidoferrales bacterium]
MKHRLALIGAILFVAGSTLAQAPSQSAPPQHQPGVPAQSAQPSELKPLPPAGAPAAAAEKVDPGKEKAIRHLMEITGSSKIGENMTENMASQVKSAVGRSMSGDRLQKFVDDFNQKLSVESPAAAVDSAEVPIYAEHMSLEDVQGMIQFYESPLGQRVMKALPQVLQETQQRGQAIERNAALSMLREMSGDYPEIKPLLPESQKPSMAPGAQQPQAPQAKPQLQPQTPPQPQQPQQ